MIPNINKFPIIILSSVRTGSSALFDELANQYPHLQKFSEPIHALKTANIENFKNTIFTTTNFLIKVHAYDLFKGRDINKSHPATLASIEKIKEFLNNNSTVIRIRRKNVIDQIASYHYASQNNIFAVTKADEEYKYLVAGDQNSFIDKIPALEIQHGEVLNTIDLVKRHNQATDNIPFPIHYDLYYEDCNFTNTRLVKTPIPDNYEKLKNLIKVLLSHEETRLTRD